ncbi:MAG TPA: MoaD/ThiS family protein [Gemmatimonadaceae bacterium]|nr:MoaD/ThiS family protein [Gemmatimonadaceae bacterium]
MTITALLFASYADVVGADRVQLTLAPGSTVGDALTELRARAGGNRLPPKPLTAVNLSYAEHTRVLEPGDELAIIPPVAGG